MDRLTRTLNRPPRNPLLGRKGKGGSGDPDMVSVPTRLTWARQAIDLGIIGATLFAAIIVLSEPANRRWSLAMGPSYRQGKQFAAVAANWAHRKLKDAKASFKASPADATTPFEAAPDVMLAMEDFEDAPRLEDRSVELGDDDLSAPTVGTLRLQQVGRTRSLHSRPVLDRAAGPSADTTVPRYEPKSGPVIDDFPVQLRLE
jgi:hypothetical protein